MRNAHLRNVDLNLLLPLQALLEERNVTKAGQRVNLSQSAMSRTLERLRETLEDDLLIRSHGEYQLTARATALLEDLELILPRLERLWSGREFSAAETTGRVRLSMTDFAGSLLLPSLMKKIRRLAPSLRVEIAPWNDRSFEETAAGKIDLLFSPLAAPAPLEVSLLFEEDFVCLISKDHPFQGKAFSLKQYLAHPHIMIETQPNQQTLVDRPLAESGLRRQVALMIPFFIPGVQALEGTDLILTCPSRLARAIASRFPVHVAKAPKEIPGFRYSMMWHPRLQNEPLHSWFRNVVCQTSSAL